MHVRKTAYDHIGRHTCLLTHMYAARLHKSAPSLKYFTESADVIVVVVVVGVHVLVWVFIFIQNEFMTLIWNRKTATTTKSKSKLKFNFFFFHFLFEFIFRTDVSKNTFLICSFECLFRRFIYTI